MGKTIYTRNERLAIIIVAGLVALAIVVLAIADLRRPRPVIVEQTVVEQLDSAAVAGREKGRRAKPAKRKRRKARAKKAPKPAPVPKARDYNLPPEEE